MVTDGSTVGGDMMSQTATQTGISYDDAVKEFIAYLKEYRSFSPLTVRAYGVDMRMLRQFLEDRLGRPATAALHADEVRKLYRTNVSKAEIARRLRIGRTSVRRILATYFSPK
jgi:site-specific recombinase XerD